MGKNRDNSPRGYTIKELAQVLPISENALHQRCARMHKRNNVLYFNGFGWYSITKPGRSYVLFLIEPEKKKKQELEKDIKDKINELLTTAQDYVCPDCGKVLQQMIDNNK